MTKDPYMLDQEEAGKLRDEVKGKTKGVFCPRRNLNIGKPCKVCDMVSILFKSKIPEKEDLAREKMAKANFYMNVVLPENKDKSVILEIGKKAGNTIVDMVNKGKWVDIAHPKSGKGREMQITKRKGEGGFFEYTPNPSLEKADWDIPEEVIKNAPNLDNIMDIIVNETEEILKISSLKEDDTLTFRMCPPWNNGKDNRRFTAVVWRHWGGVTQDEVDGNVELDLSIPTDNGNLPEETDVPWKDSKSSQSSTTQGCYGNPAWFSPGDEDCVSCKDFESCKKAVKVALKGN